MAEFQIVKAGKKDIPFVLSCIKGLAETVGQSGMVTADENMLIEAIYGRKSFVETYIVYAEKNPAGYVLFYKTFSTFKAACGLYIEDLYILPEYRNKGSGRELLEFVIDYARDLKYHKVEWYVNNKNSGAIDFYKKIGAKKLDYKSIWYIKTD